MADRQMMTPLMQAEMNSELRLAIAEIAERYGVMMKSGDTSMADLFKQMQADIDDISTEIIELREANALLEKERAHLIDRILRALEIDKEFQPHMRMPPRIRMILQRAVDAVVRHAV